MTKLYLVKQEIGGGWHRMRTRLKDRAQGDKLASEYTRKTGLKALIVKFKAA